MSKTDPSAGKGLRILVIRFSSIGDIVLTTPFLSATKKKYSNATLDYLTLDDFSPLLKDNPYIDDLFILKREAGFWEIVNKAISMRKIKYDYIFDLHRSQRSILFRLILSGKKKSVLKKHYFKRLLLTKFKVNLYKKPYSIVNRYFNTSKLLPNPHGESTEIWIDIEGLNMSLQKLNSINDANLLIESEVIKNRMIKIGNKIFQQRSMKTLSLMPFACWETKEWGDEKFIELGKQISDKYKVDIFIHGGAGDSDRAEAIAKKIGINAVSFAGKLSLTETSIALAMSDCLVTNDTGVMHIGGAVAIPVIALFGSTAEELGFFPYNTAGEVVQIDIDCRPCTSKGLHRCPKKHFRCMNDISVDMLYSIIKKYL